MSILVVLCPDISLKAPPMPPPRWLRRNTSGSHYWKLFRLWSDVRKTLGSDTPPSITMRITQLAGWQTRDGGEKSNKRILPQADTTRGAQDSVFFMHILLSCLLSAITCQCHCPEITECWKLSAIWWWPQAGREPGWHPSCAPRAAHRSNAPNALTATRTRTDLATACCHGERN